MEGYKKALSTAIRSEFPFEVTKFILDRLNGPMDVYEEEDDNQFDINSLWEHIYYQSVEAVETLLKLGADIDYQNPSTGSTPIMYSAQRGDRNVVMFLLEYGADLDIRNKDNHDVHYFVQHNGNITSVFKDFVEDKERKALMRRNTELEQQCHDMGSKLNRLMGMMDNMSVDGSVDLHHKKPKSVMTLTGNM